MKKNIPNGLTISRGILTVSIIVLFFLEFPAKFEILLFLFFLASATDFLDGYYARKWNVISEFGIVFDSLLDKVLTISVLILLIPHDVLPLWLVVALIARDLLIDGVKNYSLSQGKAVPALMSGKWKFVFQILMIHAAFLVIIFERNEWLMLLAFLLGIIALCLSAFSGVKYLSKSVSGSPLS